MEERGVFNFQTERISRRIQKGEEKELKKAFSCVIDLCRVQCYNLLVDPITDYHVHVAH